MDHCLGINHEETYAQGRDRTMSVAWRKDSLAALANLENDMVSVTAGRFDMGCTAEQGADCRPDESPVHQVTLAAFKICRYEVAQALWSAVMGSDPSYYGGCALCPVENISWEDAQEFIRKLNAMTSKRYRLPTEAEWEYAARGGDRSRATRYAGSDNLGAVAWYHENSDEFPHPIGQKAPNELGLYDMSGNVWEWCQDQYEEHYYERSPASNPQGPSTGKYRVVRGGSWSLYPFDSHLSLRDRCPDTFRSSTIGLRLALSE